MPHTIKLVIDPEIPLSSYDVIEFQRADDDVGTNAVDRHAAAPTQAKITGTVEGPYVINGLTFLIKIDGAAPKQLTFALADPAALVTIIAEYNDEDELEGSVATDEGDNKLSVWTENPGSDGWLHVTGGTALAALGIVVDAKAYGKDAYIPLVATQTEYEFVDQSGEGTHYYRWRYLNSSTLVASAWSAWTIGQETAIASGSLSTATIKVADLNGEPLEDFQVVISNVFEPEINGGYLVGEKTILLTTDHNGEASTTLVRGMVVDVSLAGTSIVRRITVPNSTTFDLMNDSLVMHDQFEIQRPDVPYAIRRS